MIVPENIMMGASAEFNGKPSPAWVSGLVEPETMFSRQVAGDQNLPSPLLRLVWKPLGTDPDAEMAMLGEIVIAWITPIKAEPGTWSYSIEGIAMKWISKGRGKAVGKAAAKRAVEEAWSSWLLLAGLKHGG